MIWPKKVGGNLPPIPPIWGERFNAGSTAGQGGPRFPAPRPQAPRGRRDRTLAGDAFLSIREHGRWQVDKSLRTYLDIVAVAGVGAGEGQRLGTVDDVPAARADDLGDRGAHPAPVSALKAVIMAASWW